MTSNQHPAEELVTLSGVTVHMGGSQLLNGINLTIYRHQQWAIIGHSGSGKTTLANVLTGRIFYRGDVHWHFSDNHSHIELVEQQHHFKNLRNTSQFYYQQRFNASEAEDSLTVANVLGSETAGNHWINVLHLENLLQKPVLQLSNGENKRLQLAKALLASPAVLILDNPFTGLDTKGRQTLHCVFDAVAEQGIQLILITSHAELPGCITHVAVLEQGRLLTAQTKEAYLAHPVHAASATAGINQALLQQLRPADEADFSVAVQMHNVTIRYGEKIILDNINWQVKKGECWSVSGPNGAGKSTLLSLITADNPQAYANKIVLFDRQRGTGESIWDIKKKIGYVSPELHVYFEQHATCFEVIASGLFDTIGLFRQLSAQQEETVAAWMRLTELTAFHNKRLFQLSASQQRMALLARALVKNPPLLILDEPAQGLDEIQTAYFRQLVNAVCTAFGTTLIYVSHYTADLPACVDHFLQLKDGRTVNG